LLRGADLPLYVNRPYEISSVGQWSYVFRHANAHNGDTEKFSFRRW
jgi:hypothetical protein